MMLELFGEEFDMILERLWDDLEMFLEMFVKCISESESS